MAEDHKSKMTTKTAERSITMERTFDAPRELVFKAFTEPERLVQWFGPRGWTTTNKHIEVKTGGTWHYVMKGPEGEESWGLSTYQEIDEPKRIVYTDAFSDEQGNVSGDMPEVLVTLDFAELDGKTKLTSRAEFASAEALKTVLDMGMVEGMTETWDRLEEYLAAQN